MLNKYYLYKQILTNEYITSDLNLDADKFDEIFGIKRDIKSFYQDKIDFIKTCTTSLFLNDLQNVSGIEISELILEREEILNKLNGYVEYIESLMKYTCKTFKDALVYILSVSEADIRAYEEAEKILNSPEREVTVIVDGNNHNIMIDGHKAIIKMKVTNNTVTLEKCKEFAENLKKNTGYEAERLDFLLSVWTQHEDNLSGEFHEDCLLNRDAVYDIKKNRLQIKENGHLVYENNNGEVCTDSVALAES